MKNNIKKFNIFTIIIGLLIMFFMFSLNTYAEDIIYEDDENLRIDGLENIPYSIGEQNEFSWNGSVYFEEKELEYGTDFYADLYSNELGDSEDEYRVSSLEASKADGSVYELELKVSFIGSYGGTVIKTIKLAPSIEGAEVVPLEGAEIITDISGSRIEFEYRSNSIPFDLKLDINGTEHILKYGTDFTFESDWLEAQTGSQLEMDVHGIGDYAGTLNVKFVLTQRSLNSSEIHYELQKENALYNETLTKPELQIIIYDDNALSDDKIIEDTDYSMSFENDLENKTTTVTITGVNNYKDSFVIENIPLASVRWGDENLNCDINWDAVGVDTQPGMFYTGSIIKPTINLTYNDTQLIEGTDYDVDIEGGLNVGDSSNVHIVFKGNYYGEAFYNFNVLAISSSHLTITKDDYVIYDGNPATLDFNIKDQYDNQLELDKDYTVEYENNNTYGEASYTITFKGNYSGTGEGSFYVIRNIIEKDDPNLEIEGLENGDYQIGVSQTYKPNPVVIYNGDRLDNCTFETVVKDKDGNIHNDGSDPGINSSDSDGSIYYATTTINIVGEYYGTLVYETLLVPRIDTAIVLVTDEKGRLDGNTIYYSYTGEKIIPSLSVTMEIKGVSVTLEKDVDYIFSKESVLGKDVSNYDLYLEGIGNYGGSYYLNISIEAISSEDLIFESIPQYSILAGDGATLDFVIKDINDNTLVLNQDYEVRYENNNAYGDASYTIIFEGNYRGTSEGSFYVAQYAVDLGSYGIDFENTYSAVIKDGKASIKDKFQDLLNDYGDYITVTNLEVETEDYQRVTSNFSYNDNIFPYFVYVNDDNIEEISHLGNDFEFVWDAALANITLDDPLFEMSKITNSSYYIGSHQSISGNPYMKYNGEELVSDDYEVTTVIKDKDGNIHYYDSGESGISNEDADGSVYTAYVNVKFKGRYTGEINYTYNVCPSIEDFMIVPNDDARLDGNTLYYDFNGKVIVPDFNLEKEINGEIKTLTLGEDFIISYINGLSDADFSQKDASDSSIEILVKGINNYAGSAYVYYKIEKRGLDDLRFDLSNNCFVDENQNVLYELEIYDEAIDYYLTSDDYTLSYSIEADKVNFTIQGGINYDGEVTKSLNIASNLIKEENISVKYDSPEGNIMYYTGEKVEPKITIIVGDYELVKDTDYKITYKGDFAEFGSTILYTIDGLADYYGRFSDEFVLEGISNIIEEVALEIISSATESVDIDLADINFEDLTSLSKDELIKAKEFYNNLEKYVVDNEIDSLVNNHIKELGSDQVFSVSEIAAMLKDYLDEYAANVGYSNFDSQVDDAINAVTVEEEKGIAKEELTAFIHRHNKATTIEKLHQVVSDKNDELDSIYYEQCLDDESRSGYFEEITNKVHEIKDVTIIIVKHTQSQAIANNNIEAYYEELKNSGKYNDAQLALLKEVFDEMQQKVEGVLSGSNIDAQLEIQEQLNQIVTEAIEKLSNVKITNIETNVESETQALVSSSSGMESNTTLSVEKALTNVSIAISRAIKSNNVYGENDGILLIKNKDVKDAFDINLEVDGQKKTEFEGEYTVRILLDDKLKSFNNLQVIYIASDGSVEVLNTTVDGDYLVFVTTHFSTYYLLGDKLVDFAPVIKILLAVIVALIILIVYLVLRIKKKKISELGFVLSLFLVPLSSIVSINVLMVCIVLGVIAAILLVVAILLAIKDYKIDRGLQDEE